MSNMVPNSNSLDQNMQLLKIWDIAPNSKSFIRIPQLLLDSPNKMTVPVFVALHAMRTKKGYVLTTTPTVLANRLGIKASNRTYIAMATDALGQLEELGLLKVLFGELGHSKCFESYVTSDSKAIELLRGYGKTYGAVYLRDLRAYKQLLQEPSCPKFYRYVNILASIRSNMRSNGKNFLESSMLILNKRALFSSINARKPELVPMLDMFVKAGVLAWAEFECFPMNYQKKPTEMVAIVNYGEDNKERLENIIRMHPSASTRETTTILHYH